MSFFVDPGKDQHQPAVAIMQPYLFPYLGYFQLAYSSDAFVFYDDVNFIKGGWINRNRVLVNGEPRYLTVPLVGASPWKKIKEIGFTDKTDKLLRTIDHAYSKAPYYKSVKPLVREILSAKVPTIGLLAARSVTSVFEYLGLERRFTFSGTEFPHTLELGRVERLVAICQEFGAARYVNLLGGSALYQASQFQFERVGIELSFLEPCLPSYDQGRGTFVSALSIIDVLMFNSPYEVRGFVSQGRLVQGRSISPE